MSARVLTVMACSLSMTWAWGQAEGPSVPFCIGESRVIASSAMNEQRLVHIALPVGYHPDSAARYPVIYLLDGSADEDFIHVTGAVQFASFPWVDWVKPSIVVGIANVDRKHDLTFPTTVAKDKADFPTTGGSAAFMRFIAKELIPFVDANYRTFPERTLIGQSLGGLFATEVLLREPSLFNHYVIVSPSLWWDHGSALEIPADALSSPDIGVVSVHITVGKEGKAMVGPARRLASLARKAHVPRVAIHRITDLDHANILHEAVMDAFRWHASRKRSQPR